jgi:hypothetical protein
MNIARNDRIYIFCEGILYMMNDHTIISQFIRQQDINYPLQKITELSLKDALCLISLIRSSTEITNEGHVGPLISVQPFAPDCLYESETNYFPYLINRNLITISKYTDTSIFNVVNNTIQDFDPKSAKWKIHVENFEVSILQLNEIIASSNWPLKWQYDVKSVWLEISVLECIEYIKYMANQRDFNIEITEYLESNILTLLLSISVSQCFYLIADAMREVSDSIQSKTINQDEAGNYFIKCCFKKGKKACEYKDRPYELPQSKLSSVFHYDFLKIGEIGFTDTARDMRLLSTTYM